MASLIDRKLLLRSEAGPRSHNHSNTVLGSNVTRRIRGFRIDYYQFISPRHRLTGVGYVLRFVEGDDGGGDLHAQSREPRVVATGSTDSTITVTTLRPQSTIQAKATGSPNPTQEAPGDLASVSY